MAMATSPEMINTLPQEPHGWRWFDPVLIGLLWIVMLIGGAVVLVGGIGFTQTGFNPDSLLTSLPFNIGVIAIQGLTLLLAVQAGLVWRRKRWSELGLTAISGRWLLITAGVAVGLRLLVIPVSLLYQIIDPNFENPQMAFLLPGGQISIVGMIAMFVLTGIVIPFAEEAFFRGVIYRYLRRWGVVVATLVSALVFAVAHLNLLVGLVAFFLGIGTAVVYERSKSLTAAFVVHAVFNTLAVLLLYIAVLAGVELPG